MPDSIATLSVAILAGGLGTRLQGVVPDRPKVLAGVRGQPFLCYLLDELGRQGIREVILLTGHRASQVQEALGASYRGMHLRYSVEDRALGTAGAVRLALASLPSRTILLLNGDSFCEVDLAAFRRHNDALAAKVSLVLSRVPSTARFGRVQTDGEGRIVRFVEKGACPGPGWINAGIYLLERDRLAELPAGVPLSLERDVLPGLVEAGQVGGHRTFGRFLDIGTPESLAEAEDFFADTVRAEVALTG
jgi:NDP-sugar pyrophosphorylase family protein